MKANKVLEKLNISRKTLCLYVKQHKIRVNQLPNGRYEYNANDVSDIENEQTIKNKILIFKNNKKIEFKLSYEQINDVLKYIIAII